MEGLEIGSLIQTVLVIIIQVLLPVALGYVVMWLKAKVEEVKARIPAEQLEFATVLAQQLVMAAEQSGLSGQIAAEGKAKKEWVIARLQLALEEKGIKMDVKYLSDLIEGEVYRVFKAYW